MLTKNFLIIILNLIFIEAVAINNPAKFIWKDAEGSGRQQKVLFRYDFELDDNPIESQFHIFADSRYHLYINGTHINFGPSRFYPANPEYDSYGLKKYLKKGKNVIAVEVLANGMNTFQIDKSIGGLIAWGKAIDEKGNEIDFKTPGEWKILSVETMDTEAIKFSFATGALENQDSNKEPSNWQNIIFDDSNWLEPIIILNQKHWGKLTKRTIPYLTQDEKTPLLCSGIYNEKDGETIHSFFVKSADETPLLYNKGEHKIGYTYIYSPKKQEVEIGTWWGSYYLNQESSPLQAKSIDKDNSVRENRVFKLNKGWNFLFVSYRAIWGGWEYIMSVPKSSNLVFSANKNMNGNVFFKTLTTLSKKESEIYSKKIISNKNAISKSLKDLKWQDQQSSEIIKTPSRNLIWNQPDLSSNLKQNSYKTGGFETTKPKYYVFDMGAKTLGRLFIDIDAPKGTIIELGWSERLNENNLPFLYKRMQINSGARFIVSDNKKRYSTFKPYGVRHIIAKIIPADNKKVVINKIGVIEQIYPYDKIGRFECSDPMFNKIWEMGWRTLRVCSEDSYTDTPFRERGLYAGDAVPEYAITLATSGDSRLLKKSLLLFQDMYKEEMTTGSENRHNDFILKTLLNLYWYYKYTNDKEFTEKLYSNYKTYLDFIENNKNKKGYYKAGKVFLEWTQIPKTSDLTAYQALLVGTFQIMEELAIDFGHTKDANIFSARARNLKKSINNNFWDKDKKAFFDGFTKGSKIDHHYPISSYYPLLFNIVDEDRKQQIIDFLDIELLDIGKETRKRKTTPYSSFYLFSALYQNGEAALSERFMKQYWSRMIFEGDDTSWEHFDIDNNDGTASHAWSGHPTYFLSTEVLGVKLGFNNGFSRDTILIQPQTENITWAKGVVPHPTGEIKIDWKIQGNNLIFNLEVPKDVPFIVEPKGKLAKLKLILTTKMY